jgi:hypothetical protein
MVLYIPTGDCFIVYELLLYDNFVENFNKLYSINDWTYLNRIQTNIINTLHYHNIFGNLEPTYSIYLEYIKKYVVIEEFEEFK